MPAAARLGALLALLSSIPQSVLLALAAILGTAARGCT